MITLYYDDTTIDIQEDEESYRYRALMEKPMLVLKFSLPEYIEFPVGTYCYFQAEKFTVYYPQDITKNGIRNIEYQLTFYNDEQKLSLYKFRNTIDRRLKFSLCAKPHEYLEYIVDNMNDKVDSSEEVWAVGSYIDAVEQTIEFNHASIDEVLQDVADTFETEWEIVSTTSDGVTTHTINLQKVEYNADTPLALSYGKGNGFVPGLGRTTESEELPIKRLYVQGGEDNIDSTEYGSQYLLLPKSQSYTYEGRTYTSDADGYYIERTDTDVDAVKEDSLDASEIYPSYTHTVTSWTEDDAENYFYTVYDTDTPSDLDYEDCIIGSENMTIIFQSGMLAGREFEVNYTHSTRQFEIVPEEFDGVTMPNSTYCPAEGDTFKVFNVYLPDAYICDNTTQTGASWDMMKAACKHLYENEDQKFTFTGTLQSLWAKRNWENVGGYLKIGGYVNFTDTQFATDGVNIRIIGIKDYISNPYAPTIELSNSVSGKSLTSTLREIKATEVVIENAEKSVLQYTRRRFRDSTETLEMLQNSLLNYSESISPITVQTMALLVGDESLQFQFVNSQTDFTTVTYNITYSDDTQQLTCPEGYLKHCTLGISSISSAHDDSEYLCWHMNSFTSGTLSDGTIGYYLYARVSSTDTSEDGEFLLSADAISMESEDGYYHLLVGILNTESDGARSYVDLYGYTEVLPGRITTDRIVSSDGESYLDLLNNALKLGDAFQYNTDGDGELNIVGAIVQTHDGRRFVEVTYKGDYLNSKSYSEGSLVGLVSDDTITYWRANTDIAANGTSPEDGDADSWMLCDLTTKLTDGENIYNLIKAPDTLDTVSVATGGTESNTSSTPYSELQEGASPNGYNLYYIYVGAQYTTYTSLLAITPTTTNACYMSIAAGDWFVFSCYISKSIAMSSSGNAFYFRFYFTPTSYSISDTPIGKMYVFWASPNIDDNQQAIGGNYMYTDSGTYEYYSNPDLTGTFSFPTRQDDTTYSRFVIYAQAAEDLISVSPMFVIGMSEGHIFPRYFSFGEPTITHTCAPDVSYYSAKQTFYNVGFSPETLHERESIDTSSSGMPIYIGDYSDTQTYTGTLCIRNVVFDINTNAYYITRSTVGGSFSGIEVTNNNYWEKMGASFSFLGSQWLNIENANIGGILAKDGSLSSQYYLNSSNFATINTTTGAIENTSFLLSNTGAATFANGKVKITTDGSVAISGAVTIEGDLTVNGTLNSSS